LFIAERQEGPHPLHALRQPRFCGPFLLNGRGYREFGCSTATFLPQWVYAMVSCNTPSEKNRKRRILRELSLQQSASHEEPNRGHSPGEPHSGQSLSQFAHLAAPTRRIMTSLLRE
jgi:hypothetical protein